MATIKYVIYMAQNDTLRVIIVTNVSHMKRYHMHHIYASLLTPTHTAIGLIQCKEDDAYISWVR